MKSKKIILVSIMSLLVLTIISSSVYFINKSIKDKEKKYLDDAAKIKVDLFLAGALYESMAYEYVNTFVGVFHQTITIKDIRSGADNFNEIVSYLRNKYVIEGRFEIVDSYVNAALKLLESSPPTKYSKTHSDLLMMYKIVCDYQMLVKTPNMDIFEYKAEVIKISKLLMQINNELELTLPKQDISMAMQVHQTIFDINLQNYNINKKSE